MEVSKVTIGQGTTMNHRERRAAAKRLVGKAVCNRHNRDLTLQGTQLICDKCREQYRKEKHR